MKSTKIFMSILFMLSICSRAGAQSWSYIGETSGVSAYWKVTREASDQYRTEVKFKNNGGSRVKIEFTPYFTCANGYAERQATTYQTLNGYEEKGGQWSGLIWYPCDGKRSPTYCELKNISVTER